MKIVHYIEKLKIDLIIQAKNTCKRNLKELLTPSKLENQPGCFRL